MSHKDSPPLSDEQTRMEAFYTERQASRGVAVGWGRDKAGHYLSEFARDAWAAWQAAGIGSAALVIAQREEIEALASRQVEWLCESCNTVFPERPGIGPLGMGCKCGGLVKPSSLNERMLATELACRQPYLFPEFKDLINRGWSIEYEPGTRFIGANHPSGGKFSVIELGRNLPDSIGELLADLFNAR